MAQRIIRRVKKREQLISPNGQRGWTGFARWGVDRRLERETEYTDQDVVRGVCAHGDAEPTEHEDPGKKQASHPAEYEAEPLERLGRRSHIVGAGKDESRSR